jgi:hypothetical protein
LTSEDGLKPPECFSTGILSIILFGMTKIYMAKRLLKSAMLSAALTVAPFLHAGNVSKSPGRQFNPTSPGADSSIEVISDYKGDLFLDGKKIGEIFLNQKIPLKIIGLYPGVHHLHQWISPTVQIDSDVELKAGSATSVHLRLARPEIGGSSVVAAKPRFGAYILVIAGILSLGLIIYGVYNFQHTDPMSSVPL